MPRAIRAPTSAILAITAVLAFPSLPLWSKVKSPPKNITSVTRKAHSHPHGSSPVSNYIVIDKEEKFPLLVGNFSKYLINSL